MSDMATKVSLSNACEERNSQMPQPTHHSACMQLAKDVYYKVSTALVDGYRTMYSTSS